MNFLQMSRAGVQLAFISFTLVVGSAQAETKAEVVQAASSAVVKASPKVAAGKVVPKVTTATGALAVKGDENQFPSGTIPIPPKPKKDGAEAAAAAAALKAQAVQP